MVSLLTCMLWPWLIVNSGVPKTDPRQCLHQRRLGLGDIDFFHPRYTGIVKHNIVIFYSIAIIIFFIHA